MSRAAAASGPVIPPKNRRAVLGGQPRGGELAQLVVDEREQFGRSRRVPGRGVEHVCHVGHAQSGTGDLPTHKRPGESD
jgi:hypothetical protein